MHPLIHAHRLKPAALTCLLAAVVIGSSAYADGPTKTTPAVVDPFLKMDSWQEPIVLAPGADSATTGAASPASAQDTGVDFLGGAPMEPVPLTMPMDSASGCCDTCEDGFYGSGLYESGQYQVGGRPDDWSWGCGGSPYRNGPGFTDDWKVGCRWETYVDGMVLYRDTIDLDALSAATAVDILGNPLVGPLAVPDVLENFDHAVGGRISMVGYLPRGSGYQVQAAYEGAEAWNAAIVFPKFSPATDLDAADAIVPAAESFEQHTVFYRTNLHSGELNIVRTCDPVWKPYMGVRFIKLDDEIQDGIHQGAPFPLPAAVPEIAYEGDRLNLIDIKNNLIGVQIGIRRDLWKLNRWVTLQGYANAGVYHNAVKRTNLMSFTTTQLTGADSTDPESVGTTATSNVTNVDISHFSELSYMAEGSLTAVCRLNRSVALRGGYQILWINNLLLAEDAFLMTGVEERGLVFQGWHAGIEYRR